ncbi:MAG: hypothetical protein M1358_21540 [Chloroflexi bacterium]|nr:hypothetical protein [Chloroflexota bacterium]
MDLHEVLFVLRRWWWLFVLIPAIALGVMLARSFVRTVPAATYAVYGSLLVTQDASTVSGSSQQINGALQVVELIQSERVLDEVRNKLNINVDALIFRKRFYFSVPPNSGVIHITYLSLQLDEAQATLNEFMETAVSEAAPLATGLRVRVLDEASKPQVEAPEPAGPDPARVLMLSILAAAALAGVAELVLPRVRSHRDVSRFLQLRGVSVAAGRPEAASLVSLVGMLVGARQGQLPVSLGIVSADGKAVAEDVAVALAGAFAAATFRVLLASSNEATVVQDEFIEHVPENEMAALGLRDLQEHLSSWKTTHDVIVFAPPIWGGSVVGPLMASATDEVVAVVQSGSSVGKVRASCNALRFAGANLTAVVILNVPKLLLK